MTDTSSHFSTYTLEGADDRIIFSREGDRLQVQHIETRPLRKALRYLFFVAFFGAFIAFFWAALNELLLEWMGAAITPYRPYIFGGIYLLILLGIFFKWQSNRPCTLEWVKGGPLRAKRSSRQFLKNYKRSTVNIDLKINEQMTHCEMKAFILFDTSTEGKAKWQGRVLIPKIHWFKVDAAREAAQGLVQYLRKEMKIAASIKERIVKDGHDGDCSDGGD